VSSIDVYQVELLVALFTERFEHHPMEFDVFDALDQLTHITPVHTIHSDHTKSVMREQRGTNPIAHTQFQHGLILVEELIAQVIKPEQIVTPSTRPSIGHALGCEVYWKGLTMLHFLDFFISHGTPLLLK
jgi:hypothetical protein